MSNSCSNKKDSTRAFYYWRSTFALTPEESKILSALKVTKLYLHFFDIKYDEKTKTDIPQAVLKFKDDTLPSLEIIPVVYIENKIFKNKTDAACRLLASKTIKLINQICSYKNIRPREIQFDCDWAESTKLTYFKFLNAAKEFLPENIQLTVTLRLHQIKYSLMTGIPPVARGTLMFYNMGDFNPAESDNSILNLNLAKNYMNSLKDYPLTLDIALPLYSWAVVFRNGKPIDILHEFDRNSVSSLPELKALNKNVFTAKTGFYINSVYIQQNDIIKIEEILSAQLKQAAEMLSGNIKKENRAIIFFDLNEKTFNRIGRHEMEVVYNNFN
jgi:hypothetical protein